MKLVCKVQHSLVVAHVQGDSGEFFFVLCRRGLEKVLKRKFKLRETFIMDTQLTEDK